MVKKVLQSFGLNITTHPRCPLCDQEEESIDHTFLLCRWTWTLWNQCMTWWEVTSCVDGTVLNWFYNWIGLCPKAKYGRPWNTLFVAVTWTTWEARNKKVFSDTETSVFQVTDHVKFRVAWWF
ncbi:hypothetical protein Dsin_017802 [Dipteronia sinensis]|uniref:Reverse transcriptase zinc-binding domain-containing protein n=1 Tax=Dipteronia sinensis TaxID=43782 RepID=A0AAE0E6S8_9ROSI|nr:hypothetical protein Dsin_017802 [Dipteronia sinensis]